MNKLQTIAFLQGMRDVLTPEGAWCQGAAARMADGRIAVLGEEVKKACSFCLIGAAQRVTGVMSGLPDPYAQALRAELVAYVGNRDGYFIASWNDQRGRTQKDVLKFLDIRIAANKAQ